ncbi:MAG TPA: hypothetical protein VKQ54_09155 [Caulobacteraceae bacterium]|nr:hypothetical protein [Caulobacteraceae bacterium]
MSEKRPTATTGVPLPPGVIQPFFLRLQRRGSDAGSLISLIPQQPDWAVRRPVRVTCERSGDSWTFTTTVGPQERAP